MKLSIIIGIFFLVLGGIYSAINWNYMIMGKTTNLNEVLENHGEPEKGEYVTLNVRYVLGNYAETKHKRYFITTGTDQHYAIILDDGSIMSVKVKKQDDIDALEAMVNPTWDYINQETQVPPTQTLTLTGHISTMESQINGFYEQALSGAGITDSVVNKIHHLTLDATETRFSQFLLLIGIIAIAAVCFLVAFASRNQMKKLEQLQDIARQNAADPTLNPFLSGGTAQQDPFAGDAAQQSPFTGDVAQQSPDATGMTAAGTAPFIPDAAATNPYMTSPSTGTEAANSAESDYTTMDSTAQNFTTPDSANPSISDSFPETSIDDYNRQ